MKKMKKRKKKRTQAVRVLDQQHYRQQQRQWFVKISSVILLSCIIVWCWLKLHDPKYFPIQVVTIEGEYQHVDKKALKQAILPFTQSNFFMVNLVGLQERLLQFPWLQSVFIAREWPNRLHIQVKEQQPIALWGDHALLNKEGTLFTATKDTTLSALPYLYGPTGEQNKVWQTYTHLSAKLSQIKLKILRLELTGQQTWSLELNNGIKLVLGQQNLAERLQRFIKAYPTLTQNNAAIDYVDLRYGHGMAVKYKGQQVATKGNTTEAKRL